MRLTKCLDCGGQVSKNAKACPHCGRDRTGGPLVRFLGWCVIIFFVIVFWPVILAALNGALYGFSG